MDWPDLWSETDKQTQTVSKIHLYLKSYSPPDLLDNQTLELHVSLTDKICVAKNFIEKVRGISTQNQRLFTGYMRELEDEKTFSFYGISGDCTLWLSLCRFVCDLSGNLKYRLQQQLGCGTSSRVSAAQNVKTGERVAIKMIKLKNHYKLSSSMNQRDQMFKRAYREVKLLLHFKEHLNIVTPMEVLMDMEYTKDSYTMYLVMELMTCDLRKMVNDLRRRESLLENVPHIVFQIICAVYALHSANVIHRDLKPENILVKVCDGQYIIKLCDFGTGREHNDNLRKTDNEDVTPLWYRAPEAILNCFNYSQSVDMWALGCILVEIHTGVNLFQVDTNDCQELLIKMIQYCGMPSEDIIEKFPDSGYKVCLKQFCHQVSPRDYCLHNASEKAVDLIKKLLVFDPDKRLTAGQALKHPLFQIIPDQVAKLHEKTMPKFDIDSQMFQGKKKLTARDWCDLLIRETVPSKCT